MSIKEPDYQWQGAQGYEWWELDTVRDKFTSTEKELVVKINDNFLLETIVTKPWHGGYFWSKTYINGAYYSTDCEHVDEALYYLFENLESLVFLQNTKTNKVKSMPLKRFEKKKVKISSKPYIKVFTISSEI